MEPKTNDIAPHIQSLEESEPKTSNHWKMPVALVCLAAFAAAFCASGLHVVAGCLLRQGGVESSILFALVAVVVGAVVSQLFYNRRFWNLSTACWLAVAGSFGSAWLFKLAPPMLLPGAIAGMGFGCGLLLGLLLRRRPVETLIASAVGAVAGIPVLRLVVPAAEYTASFYVLVVILGVTFLVVAALQRVRILWLLAGLLVLGAAAFTAPGNLSRVTTLEGWTFVHRKEGLEGAVTLVEQQTKPGQPMKQRLILDNRHIIAGQLGFGEKRLGHLPLLLNPAAKNVLFLNANGGVSVGTAKHHPGLEKIDCVEPLDAVAALLPQFALSNDQILSEPRIKFIPSEIPSYIAGAVRAYDVIVANPTPPSLPRSQQLFTQKFYADIKARLSPGGVFVQWLPLFQLDEANLKTIIRNFTKAFPDAQGFNGIHNGELPVFGLAARNGGALPQVEAIQKNLQPNSAARYVVPDLRDLLGSRLLDHAALAAFAGGGTDVLKFDARSAMQSKQQGGILLAALIADAPAPAGELADAGTGESAALFKDSIAARAEGLRHYLLADIINSAVPANTNTAAADREPVRKMLAEYTAALDADPTFDLVKQMLDVQAVLRPAIAAQAYRSLLKHSPGDQRLKNLLLLCDAQGREAEAVGVPMPPSACSTGALTNAPPPARQKILPGSINTNFYTPKGKTLPALPGSK